MTKWTDEQLNAIRESGKNIIVSAGAGSGKTAVLTERVITKLKSGIHLNQLLILTFTNNAAYEMKNRIKKAILKVPELIEEIKYLEIAEITTFDAYALSLVKKYHYELNLNKDITIIDESIIALKKKEILNNIFNNYYENNNEFLMFINTFANKNDKEIKNIILKICQQVDLLINPEEYLNSYIDVYFNEKNVNEMFTQFENSLLKRLDTLKTILNTLSNEVEQDYMDVIMLVINKLLNATSYESIRSNLSINLPRLPAHSSDLAKYYKQKLTKEINNIGTFCAYDKSILINDLLTTKNTQETIIKMVKSLYEESLNYKYKLNLFEFNDISKMVIKLVQTNNAIRDEIKNKYAEIMIDEYQDTNDIQEAFISIIADNNVYMVGDIKQSIYRFRNANPNIFKEKYNLFKDNKYGLKIDLNKNFRSRNNVIGSINKIFNLIMDDDIGNANYKDEHQMIYGNISYLSNDQDNNLTILNYCPNKDNPKDEIEAFIIANDIKNKINEQYPVFDEDILRPCKYQDFCILMDRTGDFSTYKKVFDYLQIPINIFKDEDILFADETYILNNILNFIVDIKNKNSTMYKYYYTSIARSYLFRLSDQSIYETITNYKIYESVIYKKCFELSQNLNTTSNRALLEAIITSFDMYLNMIKVGNINQRLIIIDNILNKAESLNKVGIDVYGLSQYFKTLINEKSEIKISAIQNDTDSVTLTNIHKSKGLEYKICYYSGLYKEFYLSDLSERIIFNNKYGLIVPAYDEGFKNTFVNFLNKDLYIKEELSEKMRLFYVALTRCKEKMIIVAPLQDKIEVSLNKSKVVDWTERINYKSFNDLLSSIKPYISEYITDIEIPFIDKKYKLNKEIKLTTFSSDKKLIVNEITFELQHINKSHFSKSSCGLISKEEKENMMLGTKIHYILETIDFKNPDYSLLNDFEKKVVSSLLEHTIMSNLNNAKIFKEYEFTTTIDNEVKTGIIDLILEYTDYIDIIDYKLKNVADKAYKEQLLGYKKFIQNKLSKPVNIYLYSLIEKKLVKID